MEQNDGKTGKDRETLIEEPLKAAVNASAALSKSAAEFIETVGFDGQGKVRTATFKCSSERPAENGVSTVKETLLDAPLLAIVPIPNLQIDEVNILFDMEVKESCNSKTPKGLAGILDLMEESLDPVSTPEIIRSPKAIEEKLRRISEEQTRLEEEYTEVKTALDLHLEKLKKASKDQQSSFEERLLHLIENAQSDQERETYNNLLNKVNKGLDEFINNVSELVQILSVFSHTKNDAVSEVFALDPNGSNVLFDTGDYQTADFYGKMVVAIKAQQNLNSIENTQQAKREEYDQFLLAKEEK